MEFRSLLIKLFNQLTNNDRQALHFAVGNKVPRKDRDNCTPSGSLNLLDSLFDRNLITEQNFDYLINIFEQINCNDASEQLKEYKLHSIKISNTEQILSESSLIDKSVLNIEDDKMRSFSNDVSRQFPPLSSISELEHSMLRSNTNTFSEETYHFNEHERKQSLSIILKVLNQKRILFSIVLIIITTLSIILCFILFQSFFIESSKLDDAISSQNIKQKLFYIIKEGLQYGDYSLIQNETFNDAKDRELSYSDRCIGVELKWSSNALFSIQFLYSNDRPSSLHTTTTTTTQSKELSILSSQFSSIFMLNSNEEINKINLYQNLHQTNFNIVGIQFYTTNGRKTNVFGSNDGHFITESFEYYTFGYARGRQKKEKGVEMLQFIWFKQSSMEEQIATVPRKMLEMCEFTYTSLQDLKFVHANGIESSWYDLKRKFNRQGVECDSTASYYEKISKRGPELFAIVNNTSVFYHDNNKWSKYRSAANITCNLIPWSDTNPLKEP
ncbi:unnamed protein product [Rotaria sordida]|uniref:DED domain-containing protein n=1 Tax=Rotaria sordida TaxID=392033 RepID=A0A814PEF9_9BILA|nr:unnamed protein product [Rotaria sordida]